VIRLVIVCRPRFYREGLARFFAGVEDISVEATATRLSDVLLLIRAGEIDVVLLDVIDGEWSSTVRGARAAAPARVVVMGLSELEQEVIVCAESGIAGYVTRDSSLDDIVEAIEAASRDELICTPHLAGSLLRHIGLLAGERGHGSLEQTLTVREFEIVRLIARGLSNKQIARELHIELPTVKNHVHHILGKLGVHRRDEAAVLFRVGALGAGN
jgi:two-component system, NarL family, nitrate/nitrite response regulator NarL